MKMTQLFSCHVCPEINLLLLSGIEKAKLEVSHEIHDVVSET